MPKWIINPDTCHLEALQSPGSGVAAIQFDTDLGSVNPDASGDVEVFGGEGIDTSGAGNTITISAELATAGATVGAANIGAAAYNSADFTVVDGFVSLISSSSGAEDFITDSGTATQVNGDINIFGGTGVVTSGSGDTVTIDLDGAVVGQTITGDSGGALSPVSGNWDILGTAPISTSGSGNTLTIALATPLAAIYGGTGQSSYNQYDILYADTTTSLTTLGTGNGVLFTNGGAPSYGQNVPFNFGNSGNVGGGDRLLFNENSSIAAGSNAITYTQVNGGTAGDPMNQWRVDGVQTWTAGIDNSDSDKWVLAEGSALGTNNAIEVDTSGAVNLPTSLTIGTPLGEASGGTGESTYTDGQLLIGNSANSGLEKATLTAGTGIDITNGNGSIELAVDGSVVGQTITGDSGGALSPTSGNWNILGAGETSTSGSGSTLSILSPREAAFIVDPTADNGTHQTISAAVSAASSGDYIFIRPGTYTEDITLTDGINIVGWSIGFNNQPKIVGKVTISSGIANVCGLEIDTDGDYAVECTSSGSLNVSFCRLNGVDNDVIGFASSNGMRVIDSTINLGTTGIKAFAASGAGTLSFRRCGGGNAGGSTTASTSTAGVLTMKEGGWPFQINVSNTNTNTISDWNFNNTTLNAVCITTSGSGATVVLNNVFLESGTAAALSVGANTTAIPNTIIVNSTNTNPVTGAGTIRYGSIVSQGTGQGENVTTHAVRPVAMGAISFDGNTNQLSHYSEGTWTPTIIGTGTAGTATYTARNAWYQRIGNTVYYAGRIDYNSGSGSGNLRVDGLPFTSSATVYGEPGTINADGSLTISGGVDQIYCSVVNNSTQINFVEFTYGTSLSAIAYDAAAIIQFSGSYRV